nr:MAG TPA: Insect kinin peptide [Bacteriophage sp.]
MSLPHSINSWGTMFRVIIRFVYARSKKSRTSFS